MSGTGYRAAAMVSLLSRGVGLLVKSVVGLSCAQAARCSSLPSALSATQCMTARWFSKNITSHDHPKAPPPEKPPKRPLTSYLRYVQQRRPLLAKQFPGAPVGELSKITGNEWRALSDDEKQVYIEPARMDFLKYRGLLRNYKESLDPMELEIMREKNKQIMQIRKERRKKKELSILGKPRRNCTSLNFFVSEHYHEAKGDLLGAKMKNLIHDWKNMSSSEKQVYKQLAEDDKVRYQNEFKAWEEQMIEMGRADLIRSMKKPRQLKKKSLEWVNKEPIRTEQKKASEPEGRKRDPKKREE